MKNYFYIHFETSALCQTAKEYLCAHGELESIFETAIYLNTDLSYSELSHILKTSEKQYSFVLCKPKRLEQFSLQKE